MKINRRAFFSYLDELSGPLVEYYTIQFEFEEQTEFEDFLLRHENEQNVNEHMNELIEWLFEIANHRGAHAYLFRPENRAHALPPSMMKRLSVNNLRLYCLRLSEHLVILFNGGLKTARTAQDCPNVRHYFSQANRLAKAIDDCLQSKELQIDGHGRHLLFDQDFEIVI